MSRPLTGRPVLFSGEMVEAILAGRKTQTRRIIKTPPRGAFVLVAPHDARENGGWWPYESDDGDSPVCNDGMERPMRCPYGATGDLLYLREAYRLPDSVNDLTPSQVCKAATDAGLDASGYPVRYEADGYASSTPSAINVGWGRYRHGRFMPKAFARIWLRVTDVRVERVADITNEDAQAEGVEVHHHASGYGAQYVPAFMDLWDEINGPRGYYFESDPWVWVVEFEVVGTTGRPAEASA